MSYKQFFPAKITSVLDHCSDGKWLKIESVVLCNVENYALRMPWVRDEYWALISPISLVVLTENCSSGMCCIPLALLVSYTLIYVYKYIYMNGLGAQYVWRLHLKSQKCFPPFWLPWFLRDCLQNLSYLMKRNKIFQKSDIKRHLAWPSR